MSTAPEKESNYAKFEDTSHPQHFFACFARPPFSMPKSTGKKRHRMADEENGVVSVLCYACRRSADSTKTADEA